MNTIELSGGGEVETRRTPTRTELERLTDMNAAPQKLNAVVSQTSDSIRVSDRASVIGELTAKVEQLPDLREERIEKLRTLVQAGDYRPAATDIADAILNDGKVQREH